MYKQLNNDTHIVSKMTVINFNNVHDSNLQATLLSENTLKSNPIYN